MIVVDLASPMCNVLIARQEYDTITSYSTSVSKGIAATVELPTPTTTVSTNSAFVPAVSAMASVPQKREIEEDDRTPRYHPRDVALEKRDRVNTYCTTTKTAYTTTHVTVFNHATVTATASASVITVRSTTVITQIVPTVSTKHITASATQVQTYLTTVTSIKRTVSVPTVTVTPTPVPVYAACAAANLLDYALARGGNSTTGYTHVGIASYIPTLGTAVSVSSGVNSAYQCCATCQLGVGGSCAGSSYDPATKKCTLFNVKSCAKGQAGSAGFATFKAAAVGEVAAGQGLVVSNGRCGEWAFSS